MELQIWFLFSTCFVLCPSSPVINREEEYRKLDKDLGFIDPANHTLFLKERVVDAKVEAEAARDRAKSAEKDKESLEDDVVEGNLLASVRAKIEFWEHMLAPEYKLAGKLESNETYVNMHKEKWRYILRGDNNDTVVLKIREFLNYENISVDVFATKVAGFFSCYTSKKIHFKLVNQLSEERIKNILKDNFDIQDRLIIDVAIFFIKKL